MEEKLTFFCNNMHQNHYLFELTKLCGYSEMFIILKTFTLNDLLSYIKKLLQNQNIQIFVTDGFQNRCFLKESDCIIGDFIRTNPSFFKPIYNLPCQVVYRVYVDDGHCHQHV